MNEPLVSVRGLRQQYGAHVAVANADVDLHAGEVIAIVGESGSGKTSLLRALAGEVALERGSIRYAGRELTVATEGERRALMRTHWGFVRQFPHEGLRMHVSAGANVAERLLDAGNRNYAAIRGEVARWLDEVEIGAELIDRMPATFSGGMLQRLQLARVLVTHPAVVLMDEPTAGLDVSVQARLLDLIRKLVASFRLSVIFVTHDLGVARLLADRVLVMRTGEIIETGLADQVLDDPQHPYAQLLVSAALIP